MRWYPPFRTAVVACVLGTALCAPAAAETTSQYASLIHSFNPQLGKTQSHKLAAEVIRDAQREHLDARLLVAIVTVESRWHPEAVSPDGARGLGQLMPHTARLMGVDASDPRDNLKGTSSYLGRLVRQFGAQGQRLRMAIAAYNLGPLAIEQAGRIPGGAAGYVRQVVALWHSISAQVGNVAQIIPHGSGTSVIAILPAAVVAPYDNIVSIDDVPPQITESAVGGP